MAKHRVVDIPSSNLKREITKILFDKGYIVNYKFENDGKQGIIKIALKYEPSTRTPAIKNLERASTPGLREYADAHSLPRVLNGLGVAVISTSHGVMTDKGARARGIGGEVICYVS